MSKRQWLILLGALIILLEFPILGLPEIFDVILRVIIGLIIIVMAYRTEEPEHNNLKKNASAPFVESKNHTDTDSPENAESAARSDWNTMNDSDLSRQ